MKILVGIPCLYGPTHCKAAIDSVISKPDIDVVIIDNGSGWDVKEVLYSYNSANATCIINEKNVYVNPAWNQIIDFFLKSDSDYLIIMNSDLVPFGAWDEICRNRWKVNPDEILIPRMDEIPRHFSTQVTNAKLATEGTPGVFITMNRKQAQMVYPMPNEIKIWFGDNWIYGILRAMGFKTVIPGNLFASHAWSSTVSKVPGVSEMIEQDKIAWRDIVERKMRERINELLPVHP